MNKLIRNCFVLLLALIAGMVWLDAHAAKPVKVTVTTAVPDYATQGDVVDVVIDGTGFDDGSTVRFLVTDTRDDTQIDVLEPPEYDSASGKLKARIKVKDAALVIDYDIEVRTSSGRRGKGTTMFRVQERAGQEDPCENLTSYFPAFAYTVSTFSDTELFLASADAACSVLIYKADFYTNISFRYFDNGDGSGVGRVAFTQRTERRRKKDVAYPQIGIVEFAVEDHKVITPLPLEFDVRHTSYIGNAGDPNLSPLGGKVLFSGMENGSTVFLDEMNLGCQVEPCINRVLQVDETEMHPALTADYGLSGDRVYMAMGHWTSLSDPTYVAMIERQGDTWTDPEIKLDYLNSWVGRIDISMWDWRGQGAEEVLAVSTSASPRIYKVDIWSCLDQLDWCLLGTIDGEDATFENMDGVPSVLFLHEDSTVTGPGIYRLDLDTWTVSTVVDVIGGGSTRISYVDGAD